jgi:hypothetical protein
MAMQLIFAFDSEDYITRAAADAELWWAQTMVKREVPATTCVVGELARALRDWGRRDVINAMGKLEVAYHSDMHSAHPTHAEYLNELSWEDGVAAVLQREARGVRDVADLFGVRPISYTKPGYSWAPPVPEAMRLMGIPVLSDAPFEWDRGEPMWYQNLLCLSYHCSFDESFGRPPAQRLDRMKADFERRTETFKGRTLVMYTHPCRLVTREFWDAENFAQGENMPRDHWQPAPIRPKEEIDGLKKDFDAFVAWVAKRGDVRPTTFRALYDDHRQPPDAWVNRSSLLKAAREVDDPPRPVRSRQEWLSPAEVFALVARAVSHYADHDALPKEAAVRRPLGPTAPQPEPPEGGTVPVPSLLAAARAADRHVSETGALPARLTLGGQEVGPNAFLQASRAFLESLEAEEKPREIPWRVAAERARLAARPDFANLKFRGTWIIFPRQFEAPRVAEMARWQAWTGKPARPVRPSSEE